ncbi:organoarsenical effux MFS transporter ArsJ [Akkermansiaceae bacterium]|nr:organoarsenical effux MFS transporter ArsJ [Akkermansiaceae bacterium]
MNKRAYAIVTASYWGFTLTDGALRMLVLLHFHAQGMDAIKLAFLFLLYEFCGILTNLLGGWWASRSGLKRTLTSGLLLQVVALILLAFVNLSWLPWVVIAAIMGTQALSGIAKDLTKMSAKSAVKVLVPKDQSAEKQERGLLRWVALLTGSKNALKGVGFFLGGLLLTLAGFQGALFIMAGALFLIFLLATFGVTADLGQAKTKLKFTQLFAKSPAINRLSAARLFLFAARDVWFVVGLPVFLKAQLGWSFDQVGGFMALWVIGYGIIQASAPPLIRKAGTAHASRAALTWVFVLTLLAAAIATLIQFKIAVVTTIIVGLFLYGVVFAMNSALHSYLILAFTTDDDVASNVGFYYMANAAGRLLGTLASGLSYYYGGLTACLWVSAAMLALATLLTLRLPRHP